jgi:hypothetical protein
MRLQRPSLGFTLVIATYVLSISFFAWGLSTPPLDRVWQLHHELKIGRLYKLSREDRQLLLSAMADHPSLAAALLDSGQAGIVSSHRDGWIDTPHVTIIRTPRSPASLRLVLDVQTPDQYIPYEIEVDGNGWEKQAHVEARGTLTVELPPPAAQPELITLKIKGKELRADPSSIALRVTFDPPQDSSDERETDEDDE